MGGIALQNDKEMEDNEQKRTHRGCFILFLFNFQNFFTLVNNSCNFVARIEVFVVKLVAGNEIIIQVENEKRKKPQHRMRWNYTQLVPTSFCYPLHCNVS